METIVAPIIRADQDNKPVASLVNWGLIPSWTKGAPKLKPINARCETVGTSPMFRQALERRRCLVPADGFYEWQGAKPPKQPYFIHLKDNKTFAFAGLWERWRPSDDAKPIDTFTIVTTVANELVAEIHDKKRMPVILRPHDYDRWLHSVDDVSDLLKPFPSEEMEAVPVEPIIPPKKDETGLFCTL